MPLDVENEEEVLYALDQHNVVICGVNTRCFLPGVLCDNLLKGLSRQQVLVVNIDAEQVAQRCCQELKEKVGLRIGYSVPFEDQTSKLTKIKYVSPEMMMWECMVDPMLNGYRVIVVQGFEDRMAWTDIAVCLLKKIVSARKDLKLVVETVNDTTPLVKNYLKQLSPATVEVGQVSNVDVEYTEEPVKDYVQSVIDTVIEIDKREGPGTIVAILPDIKDCNHVIGHLNYQLNLHLIPNKQDLHPSKRNVVISIHDESGEFIIDSGFYRVDWIGNNTLSTKKSPVSKSKSMQRQRLASKKCFCMYTVQAALDLQDYPTAQVLGTDLTDIVLRLSQVGITNVYGFDYITNPTQDSLIVAFNRLKMLQAIDDEGRLTAQGRVMAQLPLPIQHAKCLAEAAAQGCLRDVLGIIACSLAGGIGQILSHSRNALEDVHESIKVVEGDHITLLNIFHLHQSSGNAARDYHLNRRALIKMGKIHGQLERYCSKLLPSTLSHEGVDTTRILTCLAKGFGFQLAKRVKHTTEYKLVGANAGQVALLHSSCILNSVDISTTQPPLSPWVIYEQLIENDVSQELYIKGVSVITRDMLDAGLYQVNTRS